MNTLVYILALGVQALPSTDFDNGLQSPPGFCDAGLAWPTFPLTVYADPPATASVNVAVEWWNESPLGHAIGDPQFKPVFRNPLWPPPEEPEPYSIFVYTPVNPTPTGQVLLGTHPDLCTISAAYVLLPNPLLPDFNAKVVHLLGLAIGLAEDSYDHSIMDSSWVTDTVVFSRNSDVTHADVELIVSRIVL